MAKNRVVAAVLDLSSRNFKTQDSLVEITGDACLMLQEEEGRRTRRKRQDRRRGGLQTKYLMLQTHQFANDTGQ